MDLHKATQPVRNRVGSPAHSWSSQSSYSCQWFSMSQRYILSFRSYTEMQKCPINIAITKKKMEKKCWWGCGEMGTLVNCCWGMWNGTATGKNSMVVPQKVKCIITMGSCNSAPRCILRRTKSRDSNQYLCTSVHRSIIHNSQIWEQPKCLFTHEWKNIMWYISIKYTIIQP